MTPIIAKFSQSKLVDRNKQVSFNGGYLFLKDIYHKLKLHKICDEISKKHSFEYDLNSILANLIYTRILFPNSKKASFEKSKLFFEQPNFDLHQVYRALSVLAKENDFIQSEIYKNSKSIIKRETGVLYYDCTNFFFETEEENGLRQYGKSKEHRPSPIVQMGLFMDSNGLPLAFNITKGNENEQKTLKPIEKRIIKDFGLSKFIVCTDAGLGSTENRIFNNYSDRSYIVTQSLKNIKKHIQDWALNAEGWELNGKTYNLSEINEETHFNSVFHKERWINENGLEQRLIVSYSPKYARYQRKIRANQIERAEKIISSKANDTTRNQNSPKRFIITEKITNEGEIAEKTLKSLDQTRIEREELFDGFYAVCTTLTDPIEDIIAANKRRWEIEESFRMLKTEFKSRPVYLQNDDRIEAHFLTCYLSLLIYRILEKKLDNRYTITEIIETLSQMNFYQLRQEGFIPTYTRTDLTDKLHEIFNFRTDTEIVTSKEMTKIFLQTKTM